MPAQSSSSNPLTGHAFASTCIITHSVLLALNSILWYLQTRYVWFLRDGLVNGPERLADFPHWKALKMNTHCIYSQPHTHIDYYSNLITSCTDRIPSGVCLGLRSATQTAFLCIFIVTRLGKLKVYLHCVMLISQRECLSAVATHSVRSLDRFWQWDGLKPSARMLWDLKIQESAKPPSVCLICTLAQRK